MQSEASTYWNTFYSGKSADDLVIPSQFAAFVAAEYAGNHDALIDIGCGTGRDTTFFRQIGFRSVGVDASQAAIDRCKEQAEPGAPYLCAAIGDPELADKIKQTIGDFQSPLVYARFFLHAIDDSLETKFLELAQQLVSPKGCVAVEFRTQRDQQQTKVTPSHYRRYIDPLAFATKVNNVGLSVSYFVEGFGFAKYKSDDAHVARFVLECADGK